MPRALAIAAIIWTSGDLRDQTAKEGGRPWMTADNLAYVARIVATSEDCEWGDRSAPREFLLRVRAGDPIHLNAGLAELEFYSGARIIVHGPAVFTPTGPTDGHLESGRVTGNVTDGDFRLTTPTAQVIDLGTAFGVSADASVGTDVVVFDGRVQVQSLANVGGADGILDMTEGMAARIRLDGSTEYGLKPEAGQFSRKIPAVAAPDRAGQVSLIDIIAGGNGLENRLAGSIDLTNGKRDYRHQGTVELHRGHASDGMYHPSDCSPMIDGVFIPAAQGKRLQIDSSGRRVDVPANCGGVHGTLWARSKESIQDVKSGPDFDFWGARTLPGIVEKLKTVRIGLVGMHANMGVTIDLKKVQMMHRRMPAEFRGSVANIENSADWGPNDRWQPIVKNRLADCRIFVDGELRFVRDRLWRDDGEVAFSIPLSAEDRFLTIVTTDGDGDLRYDHVVLIDPVIELHDQ